MKQCRLMPLALIFIYLAIWPWTALAVTISYTYDDAGRLTGAEYSDGKSIFYTYDSNGNLLQRVVQEAGTAYTQTPAFNPDGGAYPGTSVSVTVSCATSGATIRYSTDGSEPTESSPTVASGGIISVSIPGTLKAKAWKSGMNPSNTKTAVYTSGPGEGYIVTSGLWIRAVFKPTWMAHFDLKWQKGGEDVSAAGDRTVWGYMYADPNDFPYGSLSNPEIFVKIYIAANGWKNIAFNHVTADDVDVFSALDYNGTPDQSGTVTLNNRLVAHPYDPVGSVSSTKVFVEALGDRMSDRVRLAAGDMVDGGYKATDELWIRCLFKPTWMAHFNLKWQKGGEDVSAAGDRTVWGYMYADPNDFPYGSVSNPEIFVKIYKAANGWQNIAFNHVTADDVDVFSAINYTGTPDQSGTVTLGNRVVAHPYNPPAMSAQTTGDNLTGDKY